MPASFSVRSQLHMGRPYSGARSTWKMFTHPYSAEPASISELWMTVFAEGIYLAGGINVVGVKWSNDLVTWTGGTGGMNFPNGRFQKGAYSPSLGRFVALADSGGTAVGIWYSDDGKTNWTQTLAPDTAYHDVKWVPELALFIAIPEFQFIYTSPDGITWTARDLLLTNNGTHRTGAWNGTRFVIVDGIGGGTAGTRAHSSVDLINWSHHVTPQNAGVDLNWDAVFWDTGLGKFIAVSRPANPFLMDSSDGITWGNLRALPVSNASGGTDGEYSPTQDAMIIRSYSLTLPVHRKQVIYSKDGVNFRTVRFPKAWTSESVQALGFVNDRFVALGTGANPTACYSFKGK